MAEFTTVTCPICKFEHEIIHSIAMYAAMPLMPFDDGALMVAIGICKRTGEFAAKSTDGWMKVSGMRWGLGSKTGDDVAEFLGSDDDDDDEEADE